MFLMLNLYLQTPPCSIYQSTTLAMWMLWALEKPQHTEIMQDGQVHLKGIIMYHLNN